MLNVLKWLLVSGALFILTGCPGSDKKIKDKVPPKLLLNGSKQLKIVKNTKYKELGATAIDDVDGEVAVNIIGKVDSRLPNKYKIYYIAKDKAGNTAKETRIVEVFTKVEPVNNFEISDSNSSEELKIEGSVINSEGEQGSSGALSDVVAVKKIIKNDIDGNEIEDTQIVYRSFNIGKWKNKLNQETTLLARVFMDPVLINLKTNEQEEVALKLTKEKLFKDALKTQKLYLTNRVLYQYIYNDIIEKLTQKAISYLSSKTKKIAQQKFLKQVSSNSIQKNSKVSSSDIDNIGGSLRLKYDSSTNTFLFRNYHNVFLGLRRYEKGKDYALWTTLQDNIINPVEGGLVGAGITKLEEWINLDALGTPSDTPMYGNAFDSELFKDETNAKANQEQLYEIYKYQGVNDITTILNILRIGEAITGSLGDYVQKINKLSDKSKKIINNTFKFIENTLAVTECAATLGEYIKLIDKDTSYELENDIDNARALMERFVTAVKPFLKDQGKYDELLKNDKLNYTDSLISRIFGNTFYPNNSKLKQAIDSIKDKKVRREIYFVGFLTREYSKIYLNNQNKLDNYNYYTLDELHYIVPMWLFMPRENAKKILRQFKYGKGAKIGSKAIPKYFELISKSFNGTNFNKWSKNYITTSLNKVAKEMEDLSKFTDLIRNTARSIANHNDNLFSIATLKIIFKFIKDSDIINIDANIIATKIAKRVTPGLGWAKLALGANEASSWAFGTFAIPNKSYFKVKTDSKGSISLEYPPFSILGLLSDDIDEKKNWIGNKIYRKNNSPNFLVVTDSYYQPIFNIYFMAKTPETIYKSIYANNKLADLQYNIRKSINDSKSSFIDDLSNQNNTNRATISPSTLKNGYLPSLVKSGQYGYYFDLYKAWMKEQGTNFYIKNRTRGVYQEWMEAKLYYPKNYTDQNIPIVSNRRFIYKVATKDEISKNLKLSISNDTLYIDNGNNFPICMVVYYEKDKDNSIVDNYYYKGDYCLYGKDNANLDLNEFKDGDEYNDVKFIFFDKIAEDYFKEENYQPPRYWNWYKESKGLEDLTYEILIDDINRGELFKLNKSNVTAYKDFNPNEKIVLTFDEELEIDDEQPPFGAASSNVESSIYFVNKKTGEKKNIHWGDWFFTQENCHPVESSGNDAGKESLGRDTCETNYKVLEISPIISNDEYQLVIEKGLKSKNGKHLDKTYSYDIKIEHPNGFEILDEILEVNKNQAEINYKIFSKYDTQKISFYIKTSSGLNVKKSLDIGSAMHGGPGSIGFGPCKTSVVVDSSGGVYIPNTINYNKFRIYVFNTRDKAIDENIDITICDENDCSVHKTLQIHLSADANVDSCVGGEPGDSDPIDLPDNNSSNGNGEF